jgi:hypothetical protein
MNCKIGEVYADRLVTSQKNYFLFGSRSSSVGVVTRLQALRSGVWVPVGVRDFPFSPKRRDRLWGHTKPPMRWALEFVLRGIKRLGREVNHLPPSGAEVKNEWNYTSVPLLCFHGLDRGNFTFLFGVLHSSLKFYVHLLLIQIYYYKTDRTAAVTLGRAMAQAVSRRSLTAEARVR